MQVVPQASNFNPWFYVSMASIAFSMVLFIKGYRSKKSDTILTQKQSLKIAKIKGKLSQENMAKAIILAIQYGRDKALDYSKEFMKKRREYNSIKRNQRLKQYLRMLLEGVQELQNIGKNQHKKFLKEIGLNDNDLNSGDYSKIEQKYENQIKFKKLTKYQEDNLMDLKDVKKILQKQIKYLRLNSQKLMDSIREATSEWTVQQINNLPNLMSIVVADQVFGDQSITINQDSLQRSLIYFKEEINYKIIQLQKAIRPLIQNLADYIKQSQNKTQIREQPGLKEELVQN